MNEFQNRVGEVSYTKNGTKATIIEYVNTHKILVEFDDKYKYRYWTSYGNFQRGQLTNPYECRSKDGLGFIGIGDYSSKDHKVAYAKWMAMLQRCTNPIADKSTESYVECEVCDKWMNFQNFAKWYYENEYPCNNEPLCVDKDILIHGNKIYSPDTCILVPQRINLLFIKEYARRGDLPIGVQKHTSDGKYASVLSTSTGVKYLGLFTDSNLAFATYKKEKEKYIKKVADSYKNIIPQKVYEAIVNYRIKITD